ncbi:MAG: alpha,alpha-trehalase [Clostridia bacterium]|nr:alpha,alpha-trehalase [Clostridia bacterium]
MNDKLVDFINGNWDSCIKQNKLDNGTLIGLPYPYSVPNIGCFDEMYYWDTYFTNIGLILSGRVMQAKYNVDNMLYLVNRIGFMPNGNRTYYLHNTQPPFLSEMVKAVYEYFKDKVWLSSAYMILEKEYEFWMNNRISPIGLNIYQGNVMNDETVNFYAKIYEERTGYKYNDENKKSIARHSITTAESGWDMTPRWGEDAYNFAPVDLNSLMYGFEKNMEYFCGELGNDSDCWALKADKRKKLMIKYMTSSEGLLLDYNYKKERLSDILTMASVYPLFTNMADREYTEVIIDNLSRIKGNYGMFACEKSESKNIFQWDYPNGWPPHQLIAIKGFDNYGYTDIATELAKSYVEVVQKNFELTGNLWEKYNMIDGSVNTRQELNAQDELPEMMGWTAGVYLYAKHYIDKI